MEFCDTCKTGREHLKNIKLKNEHRISNVQFLLKEKEFGAKCAPCMYNGITGRKRKLYKRLYPNFQEWDCYEQVE